jgi:restriction system protein
MKSHPIRKKQSRRNATTTDYVVVALAFLVFIGSVIFPYWQRLPVVLQVAALVSLSLLIIAGIWFAILRRKKRRVAWERAMMNWHQGKAEGQLVTLISVRTLSPAELERFSVQLFKTMGYRVRHTGRSGDHGVDVHLTNPNNQSELVQCKQWSKPVGEPEVRDLAGAMTHEKAERGFILAPGGFTQSAKAWSRGKNIILADEQEIGRLVESAYGDRRK